MGGIRADAGRVGLSTPLILSSMSLDINMEGTCSLIRSYLTDPKTWAKGEASPASPWFCS